MLTFDFNPFPTLTTERLALRQIVPDDLEFSFRLRNDDAVIEYLDRPKQTREEIAALIERITLATERNESISWAISWRDRPSYLGEISFWRTIPMHHRAEIGYSLLPEYWKQGLAREALHAVLTYGFETMRLHSIEANVNPNNTPSFALLEKAGFVREAYFRENHHHDGRFTDSAIYSLLHSKFKLDAIGC